MLKTEGENSDVNYKIILVGNSKVGKTSITHRVVFDQFEEQAGRTKVVNSYSKAVHIENT